MTSNITLPSNAFLYEGHIYLLSQPSFWETAQAEAESLGGNLVTINDADEEAWILDTFGNDRIFWIGFTDRDEEGNWQWIDGSDVTYENWAPGEPNDLTNDHIPLGEDYAVLDDTIPGWNDISNTFREWPGIIEIPLSASGAIQGIKWNDLNGNGIRDISYTTSSVSLTIDGTDSIFLAGRNDVTIPSLGEADDSFPLRRHTYVRDDFLQEEFPEEFDSKPGDIFTFSASGSIDFFNGSERSFETPDGGNPNGSNLSGLEGVSGYQGSEGALVGVFLSDDNPLDEAPPDTLNFQTNGLGQDFTTLSPELGQVFFIGDGFSSTGEQQKFIAPDGATRLFLGIPDGFSFDGSPGAYEDNDGSYAVTVNRSSPAPEEPGLAGVSIYLDLNNNGILDCDEPVQVTAEDDPNTPDVDETGHYAFTGLLPGTYVVREVVPDGFTQTYPGDLPTDNLLINGSFETVATDPSSDDFVTVPAGSSAIDSWTVLGETIDYHVSDDEIIPDGNNWEASDGNISLDLNGTPGKGGVAQSFDTIPGQTYRVTFDLAGNPLGGPSLRQIDVKAAGQSAQFEFDITGKTPSEMGWETKTWEFTAIDTTTTLEFLSTTKSDFFGPAIDNVQVNLVGSGFHIVDLDPGEVAENINFGNAPTNEDPTIVSTPITELILESQPGQAEPVDLSNWEVISFDTDHSYQPNWIVQPDSNTAQQTLNANASILLSDFDLVSDRIDGTWKVDGDVWDDDFMGFVFGYQDAEHFYLFDWKQRDQGGGEQGMSVKLISADTPLTEADLLPTAGNGDRVQTLFHNTIPWEEFVEYQFTLDFTPGEFTITVEEGDSILLSETIQDDTYTSGQFGFYNYSQGQVVYEGFTQEPIVSGAYSYDVDATDPNPDDILTYSLIEAPEGMTIDSESGLINWIPEDVVAGDQVAVTVAVADGQGGSDQQSFIIEVQDANNLEGTDSSIDGLTGTGNDDVLIGGDTALTDGVSQVAAAIEPMESNLINLDTTQDIDSFGNLTVQNTGLSGASSTTVLSSLPTISIEESEMRSVLFDDMQPIGVL